MPLRRLSARPTLVVACFTALALSACGDSGSKDAADGAPADGSGPSAPAVSGEGQVQSSQPGRDWAAPGPAPVDGSAWIIPPPFYAAGDEPYWRMELADGWFVFRRSGLPEIEAPIVAPTARGAGEVFQSPPLEFVVRTGACSTDSGSGDAFATVIFDGAEYEGCVFKGSAGTESPEAARVTEAIPAIDACLARLGQPAVVTAIYPREDQRTALTLQPRNGGLYECAVEQGGEIAFLDPIDRGGAPVGAALPKTFLREGVPASPTCEGIEEVRDGETLLGRFLPMRCRF